MIYDELDIEMHSKRHSWTHWKLSLTWLMKLDTQICNMIDQGLWQGADKKLKQDGIGAF